MDAAAAQVQIRHIAYMQQYPGFFWSTPASIFRFLKTKIGAFPGLWNWDMMFNVQTQKHDTSKTWSEPGYLYTAYTQWKSDIKMLQSSKMINRD